MVLAEEISLGKPLGIEIDRKKIDSTLAEQVKNLRDLKGIGMLPLPIAKVTESNFSKLDLQIQKLGDLGGTPYGVTTGKSTFGKIGSDLSFQGVIQERPPMPIENNIITETEVIDESLEATQEEIIEAQIKRDDLKVEMDKLATKQEPFSESDYRTYEKTKDLFKKNEKTISQMNEFDEGFVKNAKELFVNHSWRDMDKVGKRPYENFIDRKDPKITFPFPKGQEPTPKTHRGGISH